MHISIYVSTKCYYLSLSFLLFLPFFLKVALDYILGIHIPWGTLWETMPYPMISHIPNCKGA